MGKPFSGGVKTNPRFKQMEPKILFWNVRRMQTSKKLDCLFRSFLSVRVSLKALVKGGYRNLITAISAL